MDSNANGMPATYATGWIYALENERMPNVLKIGFTKNTVQERVAELSSHTGVPLPFFCVFLCRVRNPAAVERSVHQKLAGYNAGKEFLHVGLDAAIIAIEEVAASQQAQLSEKWQHPKYVVASATQITHISTSTTRSVTVTISTSPASPMRRRFGEAANEQLTTENVRVGNASMSVVWVPFKGHSHENK